MPKQILFIQGGGENGYETDATLVSDLQNELGEDYVVNYPRMKSDDSLPDFGWLKQIGAAIAGCHGDFVLAAHSLGASMVLKYLSENRISHNPAGIFLIATPFWSGKEDWKQGLKLQDDFARNLPTGIPIFFYQCLDDTEVPFYQFGTYRDKLPMATFREIESGGHQFNERLGIVAKDIREL